MIVLHNATFAMSDPGGITVRVTRHSRMPDAPVNWTVAVQDWSNVVRLWKFRSLDAALGFASDVLAKDRP
jgi:hypothetical protein